MFLIDGKSYQLGLILGPNFLLFVLPKLTDNDAKVVLFVDDTSIIVTTSNQGGLRTALNKTLSDIISWFKDLFLSLNLIKCIIYNLLLKIALTLL